MCGPLQAVIMGQWLNGKTKGHWLLYHLGRISTYIIMALAVYALGSSIGLPKMQGSFTLIAGLSLLFGYFGLKALKWDRKAFQVLAPFLARGQRKVKGKKNSIWFLISGSLNGLLPCGMVYAALIPAIGLSQWSDVVFYMMAFGLGTLPLLLGFNLFSNTLLLKLGSHSRKLVPISIVFIACLLIVRGLELDIPYLSPALPKSGASLEVCN
jgi:sulfite exporter TauE/SafE